MTVLAGVGRLSEGGSLTGRAHDERFNTRHIR